MDDLAVRIEQLPAMCVASFHAVGVWPEVEAWRLLRAWATPRGLLNDPLAHPVFGFNNPAPAPGRSEYGYELWLRVDAPGPDDGDVIYQQFPGGLFAVTVCPLRGRPDMPAMWRRLWDWAQTGPYRWRRAQELEKVLNPGAIENELILELYLPVAGYP